MLRRATATAYGICGLLADGLSGLVVDEVPVSTGYIKFEHSA